MKKSTVKDFFYRTYESDLNERMLERDFILPNDSCLQYLSNVAEIPCGTYVDFVLNDLARCGITTADVPQFSSWMDGTEKICLVFKRAGDQGVKHEGIGRLLLNDGKKRSEIAYRKYGEGHAKLARSLGLLQEIDKTYFLSCVGSVWPSVSKKLKERLYTRLLLRTNLIQFLLHESQACKVDFKKVANTIGLSNWGCYRRHSNVKCILDKLSASKEYDFAAFYERVDINTMLERGSGKSQMRR